MLQLACVFNTGGIILFSQYLTQVYSMLLPIVQNITEARQSQNQIIHNQHIIKFTVDSILGIIFVVVWRKQLGLKWMDELLMFMRHEWLKINKNVKLEKGLIKQVPDFSVQFQQSLRKWQNYIQEKQKNNKNNTRNQKIQNNNNSKESDQSDTLSTQQINKNIKNMKMKKQKKQNKKDNPMSPQPEQQKKSKTVWNLTNKKLSSKQLQKYDYSLRSTSPSFHQKQNSNKYLQTNQTQPEFYQKGTENFHQKGGLFNKIMNGIKKFTGNKIITQQDLEPLLNQFKNQIMQKNVAQQVARKIMETIGTSLLNKKTQSFKSVKITLKQTLIQSIRSVLETNKTIDIIKAALIAKQNHKPYIMVFIGVNGVGKSTTLAKIAYLFKNQGSSVMLAACDNFRAGAVEQIVTHGKALDLPVFQRGYKFEPATIAAQAIRQASLKKINVVLIDTAGRMQDKTPLMKQLGRIVKLSEPDVVTFIGQALVGNTAIDQLTKFNQSLLQETNGKKQIDAIILSKFDTVDDKGKQLQLVGAALTMTYITKKPILYVGVGQKYPNLRKLNAQTVANSLLS